MARGTQSDHRMVIGHTLQGFIGEKKYYWHTTITDSKQAQDWIMGLGMKNPRAYPIYKNENSGSNKYSKAD